jgi:Zn-finger protein
MNLNEGSKKDGEEEGDIAEEGIELFFYPCDFDESGASFCFCSGEFK